MKNNKLKIKGYSYKDNANIIETSKYVIRNVFVWMFSGLLLTTISSLFFGLIGIIIASLINLFANSSTADYIISIIGVIIFTGLTAYDVQKIKTFSYECDDANELKKIEIMGALIL